MAGMRDFVTQTFAFTAVCTQTGNYSVTLADEWVKANGAITLTLPVISTMQGTIQHRKTYKLSNITASNNVTVSPGTGNTIAGRAAWTLKPGESIIIVAQETATDWGISSPYPTPALLKQPFNWVVDTNDTTAVNVFDASGAPCNLDVTAILAVAKDTVAGNISIFNASDTISTFAKSATSGLTTGEEGTLVYQGVTAGSAMTVVSDSTGNARVIIFGTVQSYA